MQSTYVVPREGLLALIQKGFWSAAVIRLRDQKQTITQDDFMTAALKDRHSSDKTVRLFAAIQLAMSDIRLDYDNRTSTEAWLKKEPDPQIRSFLAEALSKRGIQAP